jgi:homocysteine S-methyltransferase
MAGVVEELVKKAGGCAVIDGGFATQLEALGADINDPLWSAACLITKPNLIKEVIYLNLTGRPDDVPACTSLMPMP